VVRGDLRGADDDFTVLMPLRPPGPTYVKKPHFPEARSTSLPWYALTFSAIHASILRRRNHPISGGEATMPITFDRVKDYLNAIAANGNLDPANSGHGVFWNVDFPTFKTGPVPSKQCKNIQVQIFNKADPVNSPFFLILKSSWCTAPVMPQMPKTGPFVTAQGYSVTLADGTIVSGSQILSDIEAWLQSIPPEVPPGVA
jgi:hypothetical protein